MLGDFQMGVANAMSAPYVPNWVEITRRTLRQAVEQVCKRWNVSRGGGGRREGSWMAAAAGTCWWVGSGVCARQAADTP